MNLKFRVISLEDIKAFSEVDPKTGCWNWKGNINGNGYGRLTTDHKRVLAHRHAYQVTHGPFPPKLMICHTCDNPKCVNPDHLFVATNMDNVRDAMNKGRWPRSTDKSNCGFTDEQVRSIRKDRRFLSRIAADYGVDESTVWRVRARVSYRDVV